MPVWSHPFLLGRGTLIPCRIDAGIPAWLGSSRCMGGFSVCSCRPHLCIQSAVTVPFLFPCFLIWWKNSAIHFAAGCICPQPPSFFVLCNVDNRTRNISPFHKNHVIVMLICLRLSFGGGRIWAITTLSPKGVPVHILFFGPSPVPVGTCCEPAFESVRSAHSSSFSLRRV